MKIRFAWKKRKKDAKVEKRVEKKEIKKEEIKKEVRKEVKKETPKDTKAAKPKHFSFFHWKKKPKADTPPPPQPAVKPAPKVEKSPEKPLEKPVKDEKKEKKHSFWFFRRKPAADAKKETKPTDKPAEKPTDKADKKATKQSKKEAKKEAKKLKQRFLKAKKKKRKKRSITQQRRDLAELILKAGHSIKPEKLRRVIFYTSFVLVSLFTISTLFLAALSGKSALGLILFYLGVWTAVFAFVYLFIWMVIFIYLDIRIYRRTRELEEVLPDFLQLASANISAGMPIDRALWFAVRPNFGVLAKEIEEVAKATLAGEELSDSLTKFTEKYDSLTLRRSINILLEGLAAGGEIADLLSKIALNIQETKIQRKEMSANVATYAIFITFASIIMAPLLFGLATELLNIIVRITGQMDIGGAASGFITLNIKTSPEMVSDFRIFCMLMLSISGLMSASLVSVIRRGRIKEGIRNLPIFIAVSLILYLIAVKVLGVMLGGII